MAKIVELIKRSANSHYWRVVAFAILGIVVGVVFMSALVASRQYSQSEVVQEQVQSEIADIQVAKPTRLIIPAVNIDATFEGSLGLNEDQTVEVPESYEELGWYKYGPRPGEYGPAVILGHVDSYQGPAVFYSLGQAEPGDKIEIEREDGSRAIFEITELLRRPQSDFPTTEVYGDIDHAGLRLITCTGSYDKGKQVYSHNLIVFAKLLSDTASSSDTEL